LAPRRRRCAPSAERPNSPALHCLHVRCSYSVPPDPGVSDGFGARWESGHPSSGRVARFLQDGIAGTEPSRWRTRGRFSLSLVGCVRLAGDLARRQSPASVAVVTPDDSALSSRLHPLLPVRIEPRLRPPHPGASQGHPGRFSSIGRIAEVRWKQRKRDAEGRFVLSPQASDCIWSSDGWRGQKRSEGRHRRQGWRRSRCCGHTENRAPAFRAPTNGGGGGN
jgi:hypothetical protein